MRASVPPLSEWSHRYMLSTSKNSRWYSICKTERANYILASLTADETVILYPTAGPMKSIVELLVSKQLAVSSEDQTCIHVVYSSQPIHEKVWKPVDSTAFTTSRHVVLKAPPYTLHTLFHELVFKAVKTYPSVSIGRNTLVIHDAVYECRVDCGPCFVNRQMSEVRVMVRSKSPDSCGSVADAILSTLFDFDDLSQPFVGVKISCSKCLLQYIDQASISTVDLEGGSELKCQKCMKDVPIKDLKQGYQESRPIQNFEWTTVTGTRLCVLKITLIVPAT